MRLLAAFLMAVGMVMLSSWGPEPVWASGCGYYECDSEVDCVWVSQPGPVSAGGTVYSNGSCDDEGPCSSDGWNRAKCSCGMPSLNKAVTPTDHAGLERLSR